MIGQIELTSEEQELAEKIVFDVLDSNLEREQSIENGERAAALMKSLMNRKAIPESRRLYFLDAEYNPGNAKASRADLFLRNAKTSEAMFRHPHFLPYLRYFVYGADLPSDLKVAFFEKAQDHWVEPNQLVQLARSLVRTFNVPRYPQNYRLPDTFYQLALDCGCQEGVALVVRTAIMRVK